jgi:transcriptional antiterminator RfaH
MWYAIYTKPNKEDSITVRLQDIGIEILNPKIKSKKFKSSRLIEVIEPLFPCYLFANFEKNKYFHLIKYTRGVRYIVGKNNPLSVHEEIIRSIKERMVHGNIIIPKPQHFERGDRVMIKDGPFRDFYGIFEREIRGSERVMILLEALYCRIELDSSLLNKAGTG